MFQNPGSLGSAGKGQVTNIITSVVTATPLSPMFDIQFGATQGSILYRDAAAWKALGPGSAKQVLQSAGPGANPLWGPIPGSVLLNTLVAPGGTTVLSDLVSISGAYTAYQLVVEGFGPGSPPNTLCFRPYVGGAFVTSNILGSVSVFGASSVTSAAQPAGYLQLSQTNTVQVAGVSGTILFTNPQNNACQFLSWMQHPNGSIYVPVLSSGAYNAVGATTGFGFFYLTGNIVAGSTVKVYGLN